MPKYVNNPKVAFHRNGVAVSPFYVIAFQNDEGEDMIATYFRGECKVAVLCIKDIATGIVDSRWRGDCYAEELSEAIKQYQIGRGTYEEDNEW